MISVNSVSSSTIVGKRSISKRYSISFLQGKTRKEIRTELMEVYEDECLSWATKERWCNEFPLGRTSEMDEEREGRPTEFGDESDDKPIL